MAMKIDGQLPAAETEATSRLATPRAGDRSATMRPAAVGDRVEVSRAAQLMSAAVKAAGDVSAVRQDVVDRMRRLLESGELGRDSLKLADAMLDRLTDPR